MKKSNIKKMVEECVREVLNESLRPIDTYTQRSIRDRFPRNSQKGLDFSNASDNEEKIIEWYMENKKSGNILRSQATPVDDEDYVFFAQVRGASSFPSLKILAFGTKASITALIGKIKDRFPKPEAPKPGGHGPGYDPERWAQYGGDPEKRPWGLGS